MPRPSDARRTWRAREDQAIADRPDVRGLSIGDAVRFTHRGETIRGHLYRRQGRRNLATVIDDADRLWKVSEAALSPSGGARRAMIVTGDDTARAQWRGGRSGHVHQPRRRAPGQDREAQPHASQGALRQDPLERSLRRAEPHGQREGSCEERCGTPDPYRCDGPEPHGRAWPWRLDLRLS